LLEQVGVKFQVRPADVEELRDGVPREVVLENARRKARAVEGARVLGVDTAVVLDGEVIGKPRHSSEGEAFLRRLSGRLHEVMSGLVLREGESEREDVVVTGVRFRRLGDREVDWYLGTDEWRDRAGAYAIQGRGAALVDEMAGDYWNVVGLPLPALLRMAPDLVA